MTTAFSRMCLFFLPVLSLIGCGQTDSSSQDTATTAQTKPPVERAVSPTQQAPRADITIYRERAHSDDAQTIEEAFFQGIARGLVIQYVEPNKLHVGGAEFRVKRNPVGDGCFVYDPRTVFWGVERKLVWFVPDESRAYALNSPSKMVTPSLKWPRDDGIVTPSTADIVAYVFENRLFPESSPEPQSGKSGGGTFTLKEYRIYREVIDTPMSISESEAHQRVAQSYGRVPQKWMPL
jgi:hypothetical protein